jgi:xanthine dehydrogenase YagS FAD-binding subunit
MKAFEYVNPTDAKDAVDSLTRAGQSSKVIAGGIDLLGEMKDYIRTPNVVVNLKSIPGLKAIKTGPKGLDIGALVTLTEIAEHPLIRKSYTALSDSALTVGTLQIRNVGTIGGNLCQRPRCWYYRDEEVICLKKGGTTCYAIEGENQYHAILGAGPSWIVHPSDCAPALIALGASVTIQGPTGSRTVPLEKFFILPMENVFRETILKHNEIVTSIHVPTPAAGTRSHYMKVRQKESFDWALSGAAVVLTMSGGSVKDSRVVLSGVAPIPWRSKEAEAALKGKAVDAAVADRAGAAAVAKAKPLGKNAYKVPLTRNTVRLAVLHAAGVKTA